MKKNIKTEKYEKQILLCTWFFIHNL